MHPSVLEVQESWVLFSGSTDHSEEKHLYFFPLNIINEAQNLAFHYSGLQDSKTEVGKLGFNFPLLKRKGFYCALNTVVPLN